MPSILVVDDDEQVRELVRRMLVKNGHDVTTATDGRHATRMLSVGPLPDIVITDIVMPEQEGIETITIIRERFPSVKVIAISGAAQGGALEYLPSAKALGAHETLAKPFTPGALYDAVAAALADD